MCSRDLTSASTHVYWPLSQDHQNNLGNISNLEFRLFIQTVQNNNVFTIIFMFKSYIIFLIQLYNHSNVLTCS